MKIGIIAFQNVANYGALLQLYALKYTLEKKGHSVNVINYKSKMLPELENYAKHIVSPSNFLKVFHPVKVLHFIARYFIKAEKVKRINATKDFVNKYFSLSGICHSVEEMDDLSFDMIFCGSDQIWNPHITGKLNVVYFGGNTSAVKIAYAASAGDLDALKRNKEDFDILLGKMDMVSVREENLRAYIVNELKYNALTVCDPTLLLSREEYERILIKPIVKRPYVLVYSLGSDPNLIKLAKRIAAQNDLDVYSIVGNNMFMCGFTPVYSAGPMEFVGWFADASYVVTDSFHGTAFSIIFKKPFLVKRHPTRGSRMDTLLEMLNLRDRMFSDYASIDYNDKLTISYLEVEPLLKAYIGKSLEFINSALAFKR